LFIKINGFTFTPINDRNMSATTTVKEKNKYEALDDAIILEALEENPDNKSEALRVASERLKALRGKEATVNQLSSRYYSYILPHYIEGNEDIRERIEREHGAEKVDFITPSAGAVSSVRALIGEKKRSVKLEVVLALYSLLSDEDKKVLFTEMFTNLEDE
jgi:hypothetical protein